MESEHDHEPTSDQGASVVSTTPRSYECNFCKRGFSNAQALGGHMNIHRKDKAKLKQQSSNQTQHEMVPSLEGNKSDEERSAFQQRRVFSTDETHVIHMKQLPLFEESPTTSSENQKLQGQIHTEIITQRALSSDQGASLELDLELRLGRESLDSSAATSTRKFF